MGTLPHRTTVFVSYSHHDRSWLDRLQIHLKPLAARGDLDLWDDTKIDAGDRWRSSIRAAIERAAASVLLISADFLASDFVASDELPTLLDKAERDGARVIPIVVQPCRLASHPRLAHFQAINSPDRPLSKLSAADAEEVFVRAAEQVERVLARRRSTRRAIESDPPNEQAATAMFAELQAAAIAISILALMARPPRRAYSLTEIVGALHVRSRRLAHDAVERQAVSGWVKKTRISGRTVYEISDDGVRQLGRLNATADGPLRNAWPRP